MFKTSLNQIFNSPVVGLSTSKEKWVFIIFITVFVTLFLLVFQPFGVNNFDPTHSIDSIFLFSMLGFGLVIGFVLSIFEFIIAPIFFKKNSLVVYLLKVIAELILVASAVFLYYNVLGDFHDWHLKSLIDFIFNVSIMSIIPIVIVFLYLSNRKTKLAFETLELEPKTDLKAAFVNLKSYNSKEQLTIRLRDLLYIEAQDNYVLVHYVENEDIKKSLLRAKIKELESVLSSKLIMRCHRSFLVNMNNVNRVAKSSGQMKLHLEFGDKIIPVSKSYSSLIDDFFVTHHK